MNMVSVEVLKSLTAKLQKGEKRILREKGLHPRKNRTGNLINYFENFTDEESDFLIECLHKEGVKTVRRNNLPFVDRDVALAAVFNNTKKGSVSGKRAHTLILDDVSDSAPHKLAAAKSETWHRMSNWLKNQKGVGVVSQRIHRSKCP